MISVASQSSPRPRDLDVKNYKKMGREKQTAQNKLDRIVSRVLAQTKSCTPYDYLPVRVVYVASLLKGSMLFQGLTRKTTVGPQPILPQRQNKYFLISIVVTFFKLSSFPYSFSRNSL